MSCVTRKRKYKECRDKGINLLVIWHENWAKDNETVKKFTSQSTISSYDTNFVIIDNKKSNGLTPTPTLISENILPRLNVGYFSIIVNMASIYANNSLLSSLNLDIVNFIFYLIQGGVYYDYSKECRII